MSYARRLLQTVTATAGAFALSGIYRRGSWVACTTSCIAFLAIAGFPRPSGGKLRRLGFGDLQSAGAREFSKLRRLEQRPASPRR